MVRGEPASREKGKRVPMSGKTPTARDGKKTAKLSLKEKRAVKRAKQEPESFIRSRKGA